MVGARLVLEYVGRGEVDAGIVFFIDAAIVKDSAHSGLAKDFIAFISGDEGRRVFGRYGFETAVK